MSTKAFRVCGKPGCSKVAAGKYCSDHLGEDSAKRQRYYAERSEDPLRRQYFTAAWRQTRIRILSRDLFCRLRTLCGGTSPSEVVHHIVAAKLYVEQHGGDLSAFYDEENLEGACKPCHDAHTAAQDGGFGNT